MSKKLTDVDRNFKKPRIMDMLLADTGDNLQPEEQITVNAIWEILRLEHEVQTLKTMLASRKLRDLISKTKQ